MSEHTSIVWVLGSGFSVPLGGPMLGDLLSLESRRDLELAGRYDANSDAGTYWLYHYGRKFKDGNPDIGFGRDGERLWDHAEDFLDRLDAAVISNTPLARRLKSILAGYRSHPSDESGEVERLKLIRTMARRVVAAECCEFLRRSAPGEERWRPQCTWVAGLGPHDVVVTFNYDRVLETIEASLQKGSGAGRIRVVLQGNDWQNEVALARVLKLHGSVDWRWAKEENRIHLAGAEHAETCPEDEVLLATPGPTKQGLTGSSLGHLWACAREAIENTSVIVFVGYRFPPSDAQAREQLLGALSRNAKAHLDMHVVLGSATSDDAVRLAHMLETVAADLQRVPPRAHTATSHRTYRVIAHPLYSQDFFTLVSRNQLTRHLSASGVWTPVAGGA